MSKELSRRSFLKVGATAAAGLAVAPNVLFAGNSESGAGRKPKKPLDRKLKIIAVGIGGRGASVLQALETEDIIGLCDVDWKYADHVFKRYPNAKRYNDYRVMFKELLPECDAVMCATADHTHAILLPTRCMSLGF